ncbi:Predicted Zn-dependent peptidase [Ekhidna lutea]|uniref:Predicted Zn-dependent peptidase n=1 Tax=Ekhidna lutea TaxID=447679 RepID=A0A239LC59_EKHLU|nr:pitrilysin family protein [Ekhidna lutea]SNT27114.1 Predicted Zn-dependent peptidase [Ekhidna lutea]
MKTIFKYIFYIYLIPAMSLAQEKETPPPGGEPKGFTLPAKETFSLENGLKGVMVSWGSIPKATIQIVVKTGNINEGPEQVWLSDLVGDLMQEGSLNRTGNEVADEIASMGGDLSIGVGQHTTTLTASVLYEYVPDAIELMADVLTNPAFPEEELGRLINDQKRQLSVSMTQPQPQAMAQFYASIYPDHAYGRIFPTDEMLDSYTIDDVKSFYNENFGAKRTTVYVAGKFDAEAAKGAIEKSLSGWIEGEEANYPIAEPQLSDNIQMIDRPDAPQSTIMIGLPVADPSNPDYIALDITNSLLGGSFGSRITSNIREDKGYTYSPYSTISDKYKSAVWYEMADVTTDVTGPALREITKEVFKLQDEPPSKEELDGIKNYEAGIYVLQNSTPGGIIGQLSYLDIYDLPESFLTDKVKNIYAVTPEQVSELVKKYIRPEDMKLVIVGDKEKIEEQINEYEKEFGN